jgi:hypothetical protein
VNEISEVPRPVADVRYVVADDSEVPC